MSNDAGTSKIFLPEPGIYWANIIMADEYKSQAGNMCLRLRLQIAWPEMGVMYDYLPLGHQVQRFCQFLGSMHILVTFPINLKRLAEQVQGQTVGVQLGHNEYQGRIRPQVIGYFNSIRI